MINLSPQGYQKINTIKEHENSVSIIWQNDMKAVIYSDYCHSQQIPSNIKTLTIKPTTMIRDVCKQLKIENHVSLEENTDNIDSKENIFNNKGKATTVAKIEAEEQNKNRGWCCFDCFSCCQSNNNATDTSNSQYNIKSAF